MKKVIAQIKKEFLKNVDPIYKKGSINFFKEPIDCYGVRIPIVRKIGNKYYQEIKNLSKQEVFKICEELLKTNHQEDSTIAFAWALNQKKSFTKSDFKIFESWIKKYINNWAKCDDFCVHCVGELLIQYPELIKKTKQWTKSKNKWLRRASAVSLILPIRKKDVLKDVFEVANKLLQDKEDMVQKGYGWMLKVVADIYQAQVFNFVMKNKDKMPRTALRYAIEKMPPMLKKQAMSK